MLIKNKIFVFSSSKLSENHVAQKRKQKNLTEKDHKPVLFFKMEEITTTFEFV